MKIVVKGVSVVYRCIRALDGVSVELESGKVTAVVGPNGAGKTTLLRCINGVVKPRAGVVLLDGTDIRRLKPVELAKRMGHVPQLAPQHLPLTVFETVALGRRPYVSWALGEADLRAIEEAMRAVGVEHLSDRYFDELSGGERQKVLIAMALAQEPEVLLLDEPTSNLDIRHQLEILSLIRRLAHEKDLTVLMAMHDLNLASRFSDTMVMLKDGRIFAIGTPSEVLTPENIRAVYGVEAAVLTNPHLLIVPLEVVP